MTRFIGNSFRVTPLLIQSENPKLENLDFIERLMEERKFDPDEVPSAGWIRFQSGKEGLDTESNILSWELPNGMKILPATSIVYKLNTELKRSLPPSSYADLPLKAKYKIIPIDFVFYQKDNKLYALISATSEWTVDSSIRDFLNNIPFTDYGFIIQKNPEDAQVPDDLIFWLLYCYCVKGGVISPDIKIKDISHLNGTPGSHLLLEYDGKSTPTYLPEVRFSISQKRTFYTIKLTLGFEGCIFEFHLFDNGNIEFYQSSCEYLSEEDIFVRNLATLTHIYTDVIPEIKNAYRRDHSNWTKRDRSKFIKENGVFCEKFL